MDVGFLMLMPKLTTEMPLHHHQCYEFHYVVAGSGHFVSGNRRFAVKRGDFFYDEPYVDHQARVRAQGRDSRAFLLQYALGLFLDKSADRQLIADLKSQLPHSKPIRLGDGHQLFFERLRRQHSSGQAELSRAAAHTFAGFLYEIMRGDTGLRSGSPVVEEALRYIQSRVTREVSLDDLADQFDLSKAYFVRLFKKHVGISPMRYVFNLRMELACELLKSPLPLAEIAVQVGFADEYQFSKRFKQWSGKPPGRYRQSLLHD